MEAEILFGTALRVLIVAGVAYATVRLVPRWSASSRHRFSFGSLLAATLVVPMASLLPRWSVPVLPAVGDAAPVVAPVWADRLQGAIPIGLGTNDPRRSDGMSTQSGSAAPSRMLPVAAPFWFQLGAWAWGAGTVFFVIRCLVGQIALQRLARKVWPVDSTSWNGLVGRLAQRLGVRGPVRLVAMAAPISPAAFGIVRPSILLPFQAAAWRGVGLGQVLLHELAHLRRRDPLQRLIAELCCAAFWFVPTVWLLERRMRVESERACDDLVLSTGASASGYAAVLLGLRQKLCSGQRPGLRVASFVHHASLEERVRAILEEGRPRGAGSQRAGLAAGAVMGLVTLALATVQPVRAAALVQVAQQNGAGAMAIQRLVEASSALPAVAQSPVALSPVALSPVAMGPAQGSVPAAPSGKLVRKGPVEAHAPGLSLAVDLSALARRLRLGRGALPLTASVRVLTLRDDGQLTEPSKEELLRLLGMGGASADHPQPPGPKAGTAELMARERHRDHLRATYNFGFATRDDRARTLNNWDLQLRKYRAPYTFDVNMAGSDHSRIVDLGPVPIESVRVGARLPDGFTEAQVPVHAGHTYLIHTLDSRSDYWTRLHVTELTDDGVCRFDWELLQDDTPIAKRRHP